MSTDAGATDAPRPRRRRRAVGGTPTGAEPVSAGPAGADPLVPGRSRDDTDQGWGGRPSVADDEDDERFLREVPPHW